MGSSAMLLPAVLSYAIKTALATVKPTGNFTRAKINELFHM
jgi:hypothetical protein